MDSRLHKERSSGQTGKGRRKEPKWKHGTAKDGHDNNGKAAAEELRDKAANGAACDCATVANDRGDGGEVGRKTLVDLDVCGIEVLRPVRVKVLRLGYNRT